MRTKAKHEYVYVWFDNKKYIRIHCDSYQLVHCKHTKESALEYRFLDKKGNVIVSMWAKYVDTILN